MRVVVHKWIVTMQGVSNLDGQMRTVERECIVGWDPNREGISETVANAAAAEATCEGERMKGPDGSFWKEKFVGISARLADASA